MRDESKVKRDKAGSIESAKAYRVRDVCALLDKGASNEHVIRIEAWDEPPLSYNAEHENARKVTLNAAIFDIECLSFTAGGHHGMLTCCCVLPLNADAPRVHRLLFSDARDDRRLLAALIDDLSEFDILIGHNINNFDLPFIESRLAYHHKPVPRTWYLLDTYLMARQIGLRADRKSLAFLLDYFQIKPQKTSLYPVIMHEVFTASEDIFETSMEYIIDHCSKDVLDNRVLFDALWPRVMAYGNTNPFKKTKWSQMRI